jgi:hypothetical protein
LAMISYSWYVQCITAFPRFTLSDAPGQNSFPRPSSMHSLLSRQLFLVLLLIIFYNFVLILLLNMSNILLTTSFVTFL